MSEEIAEIVPFEAFPMSVEEIRLECLRLATETYKSMLPSNLVDTAKRFEDYVRGPHFPQANPNLPDDKEYRDYENYMGEKLRHSRACGIVFHQHGYDCSTDCPTCQGKPATWS